MLKNLIKGDFSEDYSTNIEIISNSKVIIGGVRSIIEYEDTTVRIDTEKFIVSVQGTGLSMNSYKDDVIIVCGIIKGVMLDGELI